MSYEPLTDSRIPPERWYGEKLGHLSRHNRVALMQSETEALCTKARKPLNVFAIRKSFLNAGGKEEHWREIAERLSALHSLPQPGPGRPVLLLPNADESPQRAPKRQLKLVPEAKLQTSAPRAGHARSAEDAYKRLGDILVQRGAITPGQLERALQQQLRTGERLGSILVSTRTIDPHALAQALAAQTGLLAVDLDRYPIDAAAEELLPPELCEKHCMFPLKVSGQMVLLAMGNPSDADAYTASREALPDKQIRRIVAAEIQIQKRLKERKRRVRSGR